MVAQVAEFCLFYPAYTHKTVLEMPYVLFLAMMQYRTQILARQRLQMQKLEAQQKPPRVPKWPTKK